MASSGSTDVPSTPGDAASPSPCDYDSLFAPLTPEPESLTLKPLTFQEVWGAIMRNPLSRMWAFNMKPPTAYELLLSQEMRPFEKSYDIKPPDGDEVYDYEVFRAKFFEVFTVCHTLSDGTFLGFALHSGLIDVMAVPFAALDPTFNDPTLSVNRLLLMNIKGRMAVVEFCWLKSGALTIRYGPYNSLTASRKRDLRVYHSIYAFAPTDAQTLATCALVGDGVQDSDFLNAKFDNILLSNYFLLSMIDTRYQDACLFCKGKGHSICGCPMPMRRRTGEQLNQVTPYRIPTGRTAWDEFPTAKSECAKKGTLIFNLKMRPHSQSEFVVWSALFPFDFELRTNVKGHPTLQQHMYLSGSLNPLATAMNNLKRTHFHNVENMLFGGQNSNNTATIRESFDEAANLVQTMGKRVRRIENGTVPNEEEGGIHVNTGAPRAANIIASPPAIYNIQIIVQQNGNSNEIVGVPQMNVLRNRNITGTSNENPLVQDQLPPIGDSSSLSPANSGVSATRATTGSSTEPASESAPGSGSANGANGKKKKKSWDCPECGVTIHNKKSNLNRHIEAIHKKKKSRFQCETTCKDGAACTATFQTAYNLKRHRRNAHEKGEVAKVPAVAVGDE